MLEILKNHNNIIYLFGISVGIKDSKICTPFTYLCVLAGGAILLGVAFSFSWAGLLAAPAEAGSQVFEKNYIR